MKLLYTVLLSVVFAFIFMCLNILAWYSASTLDGRVSVSGAYMAMAVLTSPIAGTVGFLAGIWAIGKDCE